MSELSEAEIILRKQELDERATEIRNRMTRGGLTGEQRNEYQILLSDLERQRLELLTKPDPYEGREGAIRMARKFDENGEEDRGNSPREAISMSDYDAEAWNERWQDAAEAGERKLQEIIEADEAKRKAMEDEIVAARNYEMEKQR